MRSRILTIHAYFRTMVFKLPNKQLLMESSQFKPKHKQTMPKVQAISFDTMQEVDAWEEDMIEGYNRDKASICRFDVIDLLKQRSGMNGTITLFIMLYTLTYTTPHA